MNNSESSRILLLKNNEDLTVFSKKDFNNGIFTEMDKLEILHMLVMSNVINATLISKNCIEVKFDIGTEWIYCPIQARKEVQNWFKEIKICLEV